MTARILHRDFPFGLPDIRQYASKSGGCPCNKLCLDHDVVLGRPWIFVQRLLEDVRETLLPRPPDVLREGARISEPCIALRTHGVMPIDVSTWSIGLHDEHRDRLVDQTLLRSAGKLGQHIVKQVGALVRDDRLSEAGSIIHDDDA